MYDTSQQPKKMRDRYAELPDEVRELFEYGTVEQTLQKISQEFGLKNEDISLLQMEVDLILYGFLTRVDLALRLQESLSIEELRAKQIAKRLEEDLFVIVEQFLTYIEGLLNENEDFGRPLITTQIKESSSQTPESSVSTGDQPEDVTTSIKPLRTFAEDVELSRVHGYGSFQSGEVGDETDDTPVHHSSQDDVLKK